mmetsp:Transcript_24685/g.53247  ORF Transcript_24685/g.53247 Transcript_24685/m.53247 type:complete len:238 (-) Transcript_24685:424-1137(-)|eukprot:CAMPEP_0172297274 /NCGR_PEP_ID=MMETSP1058-20130122/361_1 /TAXON_ID=83371 /ORGANISM="Detonula confervacea, Strain CCMP 353" /LENGTH=237 /DNA_ID=CAMNT_0013006405 /DNA_START=38 /DNA_END=751 /DNA_ORIENTATION=+
MVQSVNLKALSTLASVVRRPYLAAPHVFLPTVSDMSYEALRDHCGIKAVIFDKDNTLTAPYENSLHPRAKFGLQSALDTFGTANVAILSNSAGTDDDPGFVDGKEIEEALGIAVIQHSEKKPGGLDEVMQHFPNVDDASELCMVGDRLLTDIVFGNLHGMLTVHVLPLCSGEENKKDNKVANVVRKVENKIMYADWWGGKKIRSYTLGHSVWKGEDDCPLVLANKNEPLLGDLEEKK